MPIFSRLKECATLIGCSVSSPLNLSIVLLIVGFLFLFIHIFFQFDERRVRDPKKFANILLVIATTFLVFGATVLIFSFSQDNPSNVTPSLESLIPPTADQSSTSSPLNGIGQFPKMSGDFLYGQYFKLSNRTSDGTLSDIVVQQGDDPFTVSIGSFYLYHKDGAELSIYAVKRVEMSAVFGANLFRIFSLQNPLPAGNYVFISLPAFPGPKGDDCDNLTLSECRKALAGSGSHEEAVFKVRSGSPPLTMPPKAPSPWPSSSGVDGI